MAIAAFLGSAEADSTNSKKEFKSQKTVLRPENMLLEIIASLRASGNLCASIQDAITRARASGEPVWIDSRSAYSVAPDNIATFNSQRAIIFVSGFPPYCEDPKASRVSMSASLHHCPEASDGLLGLSGHLALHFRKLDGKPYQYQVFGSFFSSGDDFQIKPYAIAP
jgi:hypothetical protein